MAFAKASPNCFSSCCSRLTANRFQSYCSRLTAHRSLLTGFTLVELMVVLAIIAMLAGLIAVNVREVRERARQTTCKNNLHQHGVALNSYFADYNNYFILPSGGGDIGTGIQDGTDIKTPRGPFNWSTATGGKFSGLWAGSGTVGDTDYHTYLGTFVPKYVRLGLSGSQKRGDVTVCPEVDLDVFTNSSPKFKGYYDEPWGWRSPDYASGVTTYGINSVKINQSRDKIPDHVIAFADWNAAMGWNASLCYYTTTWFMSESTVGKDVKKEYQGVYSGKRKDDYGYHTELGFHHRIGTNRIANYVAMDGHVDMINSNAPPAEFQRLFYGQ